MLKHQMMLSSILDYYQVQASEETQSLWADANNLLDINWCYYYKKLEEE